ncbi:MAG: single-stranded DNA-binding protein [Saprospiraceae bacterium]|nr:single-stranded DNA-binding protein [Saprospiraceae bacterium]
MLNRITLIGNLGRDPEVRRLDNGAVVARLSIATNESYKDKNNQWQTITEWHELVLWRQLAERAEQSLKKGMLVYIEGKLRHRKYTDKNNIERAIAEVDVETFRILERRDNVGGAGGGSNISESVPNEPPISSMDDDLPF